MKLVSYSRSGDRRIGFLVGDAVHDLAATAQRLGVDVPDAPTMLDLARVEHLPALAELDRAARERRSEITGDALGDVTLHAPYRPRQNIICAGGNTKDPHHADRIRKGKAWLSYYSKAPSATVDPGQPITFPGQLTSQVYAEPELAVIVGATISYVEPDAIADHLFGFSVATNVSGADLKRKHGQWDKAASFDTFFPWGPVVVTADELDLSTTSCRLWLNDRMALSGAAESGLLTTAEIVSEISFGMRLLAGDVLLTGVAESEGHGQIPERWLQDGDVVRSAVEGIGQLENTVQTY